MLGIANVELVSGVIVWTLVRVITSYNVSYWVDGTCKWLSGFVYHCRRDTVVI